MWKGKIAVQKIGKSFLGKKVGVWLEIGIVFGLSCLLHFLYDWTGGSVWAGIFAAANESVWEHAKIISGAYALVALAEFLIYRPNPRSFWTAKTFGIWFLVVAVIVFYYLYTAVIGSSGLWVHLISTVVWIACAAKLAGRIGQNPKWADRWFTAMIFALLLYVVCYLSFTVNPPHWGLFEDPQTGEYGLPVVVGVSTIPV